MSEDGTGSERRKERREKRETERQREGGRVDREKNKERNTDRHRDKDSEREEGVVPLTKIKTGVVLRMFILLFWCPDLRPVPPRQSPAQASN